jgi:hypothetical protein
VRGNRVGKSGGMVGSGDAVYPLSARARRLLAAVAVSLDGDGTIQVTVPELAGLAGQSLATAERAMSELVNAGIVHVVGATRAAARYIDPRLLQVLRQGAPDDARTVDRTTRARLGGLQRALVQAQQQRDDAQQKLRSKVSSTGSVTALLVADLRHAFDCTRPGCARCEGIRQRLAERHPAYVGEVAAHDLADHIERGALAARAGAILVQALDANGVGSRSRVTAARRALALAVDGDVGTAGQLLQTLEG